MTHDPATCPHVWKGQTMWRLYGRYGKTYARCFLCHKYDRGMDSENPEDPPTDYFRKKYGITGPVTFIN